MNFLVQREVHDRGLVRIDGDGLHHVVVSHEASLDLALGVTCRDSRGDQALDLLSCRRVGLVEGRPADGTHDLTFELGQRRVPLTGTSGRDDKQRRQQQEREPSHDDAICCR